MTSLNKLNRAVESLKSIVSKSPDKIHKKTVKLTPCSTITEIVCKSQEKNELLTFTVTSLIQVLEDADSNTRLIIDESLNKIIRSSVDNSNHVAKILIALLKILGKNTNERCLKAALWRFAELAQFVRPHKGKIYVQTLLPVILNITGRKEESIHVTLADSLPNIFKHIGLFTTDNDIKILLKAFLKNLRSNSVEIRRAAAFCITVVCKYSRKPKFFFSYALTTLLDLLCDCLKSKPKDQVLIQGGLSCVRQILPHIISLNANADEHTENLLQIYELTLIFAKCQDHNVVTAALETLQQLLTEASLPLILKLTSLGGIKESMICNNDDRGSTLSLAAPSDVSSIGSTIARTEEGAINDGLLSRSIKLSMQISESYSDLNSEQKQRRIENWVQEQPDTENDRFSSSSLLNINASHFANSDDEDTESDVESKLSSRTLSLDNIQTINDQDDSSIFNQVKPRSQSIKSISGFSTFSTIGSMNNLTMDMDIGDIIDEKEIPLNYCARLLISNFLLDGKCENSKRVRVSVMSLALNCLAKLLKIYPAGAFISIEKDKTSFNCFSDILNAILSHVKHDDQQIRGLVRTVIGHVIASCVIEDNYLLTENDYQLLSKKLLNELIIILMQGMEDESSVCIKHSLQGVSVCLEHILLTPEFKLGIPLLESIFTLVENPYWLIKTKILEIFEDISYELLYFIARDSLIYQEKILKKVIITLLGNQDGRVRTAASQCLLKFIANAYHPIDHNYELLAVTLAKKFNSRLKTSYMEDAQKITPETSCCNSTERSLARVNYCLTLLLRKASSENITGYCQALSVLAEKYPPVTYPNGWQCLYFEELCSNFSDYSPCELFETVLFLMTNTSLILNFDVHLHLLRLNSQLFVALCDSNLKMKRSYTALVNECTWSFLVDEKLKRLSELFLRHLIRLTSIFNDAINDVVLKSPSTLNSSSNNIRPLPIDQPLVPRQEAFLNEEDIKQFKNNYQIKIDGKPSTCIQYHRDHLYMKLRTSLKSAYNNYEVTLKPESSEKFISFLKTVLQSFSIVLDYVTISEVDRFCKDLLSHLRNFTKFLPVYSIHCVVQLLKCVFGSNTIAEVFQSCSSLQNKYPSFDNISEKGFYDECFQDPYEKTLNFIEKSKTSFIMDPENEYPGSPVMKMYRRNSNVNMMPSYIKLFEPNVILSLRQYTVTSDTVLQAQVLRLLSELIQLKVNYCLLDSEQVFINFLLSQFQLIEEEQLLNVDRLLPAMFNFLIHLANEKHSKPIMSVPKVIQLCDSLIASVQSVSNCILAIDPVVHYVFLKYSVMANTNEIKELETQRDVLFAMILKLIHESRSLQLLTLILNNSEDEQKLKRSSQIAQIFFNALIECKISSNENCSTDVLNLILALHPASFDEQLVLSTLLNMYHNNKLNDPSTWLPFFSVLLLILMRYDENMILLTVKDLLNHPAFNDNNCKDNFEKIVDPLCVSNLKEVNISPESAFVQFLCKIIKLILKYLEDTKLYDKTSYCNLSRKMSLFSELLSVFSYLVKSGKYEVIRKELINSNRDNEENIWIFEISHLSYHMLTINPITALRWYEVMLFLRDETAGIHWYFGQSSTGFSTYALSRNTYEFERQCLSNDIIKLGVLLLVSSHKDEFMHDTEILKRFLEYNFNMILNILEEPSIRYLLTAIQNSEGASNLLIDIIRNMYHELIYESNKMEKALRCLSCTHEKTRGKVLSLCCRLQLLDNHSSAISNAATKLTTEIVNHLVTIEQKADFETYLNESELSSILEELKQTKTSRILKLVDSLYNVAFKWFGIQVPSFGSTHFLDIDDDIRLIKIDEEWFLNFVKQKCCVSGGGMNTYTMPLLLSYLPYDDIFNIMCSQNFNKEILRYCFSVGTQLSVQKWQSNSCETDFEFSYLYSATRQSTFRHIERIRSLLPRTHQVYLPVKRDATQKEIRYSQRMDTVFSDKEFVDTLLCLIPTVNEYMLSAQNLMSKIDLKLIISTDSYKKLIDFAVLSLEMEHWIIRNHRYWSKLSVMNSMKCCSSILEIQSIMGIISSSQLGSIISSLFTIVEHFTKDSFIVQSNSILEELKQNSEFPLYHSSHVLSVLIDYFVTKVPSSDCDPSFIANLKELMVVLSQSASVYNYLRLPLDIWKHVSFNDVIVGNCLTLNTIPENYLEDSDILQNFVSRLMFIGWNNRLQFEECWMLLLIAFNSLPECESTGEEVEALSQVNTIAVSAVTSLLVQTMYHPVPGCKTLPSVFHVSRNSNSGINRCRKRSKLKIVNDILSSKIEIKNENFICHFNNVNVNIERLRDKHTYNFNQISVEYLSLRCGNRFNDEENMSLTSHYENIRKLFQEKENALKNIGVDTNSCVYFLMDFYSRWLLKPDGQSIYVLLEIVNSMLVISDLFTELTQFNWLLESGILLWRKYAKNHETVCTYLIIIICKSAAVSVPTDSDIKKMVLKILKSGLNSKKIYVQNSSLHGLLYLLETVLKKDVLNQRELVSGDFEDEILSAAICCVLEKLDVDVLETIERETAYCLISIAFYLIENNMCGDNTDILIDRLLKLSVRACKLKLQEVYSSIIQGFYNLILCDNHYIKKYDNDIGQLVREIFSIEQCTDSIAISGLQILITSMYTYGDLEDTRNEESNETFDTEKLISRIEKISIFFNRIKKCNRTEAQLICSVLPQILNDFFPPSEILNKLILEFLSPQHPYPELMASVVFKVFQNSIQQSQLNLIQDWVLSLLNNFRNYPLPQAVFYLTCFFISACTNPWLTVLFPSITLRRKQIKYEDRRLLCIAAVHFYTQLNSESQKSVFISTFKSAQTVHPDSPFSDILKTIL